MTLDKKMSLCSAKIGIYSAVIAITAIFILANCILAAAFPVYAEHDEVLVVPMVALVAFLVFATFELVKEIRLKKGLALGNDEDGVKTTTLLEDATATLISHSILLALLFALTIYRLATIKNGEGPFDIPLFIATIIYVAIEIVNAESKRRLYAGKRADENGVEPSLWTARSLGASIFLMIAGIAYTAALTSITAFNGEGLTFARKDGVDSFVQRVASQMFFWMLLALGVSILLIGAVKLHEASTEKVCLEAENFDEEDTVCLDDDEEEW
jgi:hypothetical protein